MRKAVIPALFLLALAAAVIPQTAHAQVVSQYVALNQSAGAGATDWTSATTRAEESYGFVQSAASNWLLYEKIYDTNSDDLDLSERSGSLSNLSSWSTITINCISCSAPYLPAGSADAAATAYIDANEPDVMWGTLNSLRNVQVGIANVTAGGTKINDVTTAIGTSFSLDGNRNPSRTFTVPFNLNTAVTFAYLFNGATQKWIPMYTIGNRTADRYAPTWTQKTLDSVIPTVQNVSNAENGQLDMAVDSNRMMHLVWTQPSGTLMYMMYNTSSDTFSNIQNVTSSLKTTVFASRDFSIVATPNNDIYVFYTKNENKTSLYRKVMPAGASSFGSESIVVNQSYNVTVPYAVVANDNSVFVTFSDDAPAGSFSAPNCYIIKGQSQGTLWSAVQTLRTNCYDAKPIGKFFSSTIPSNRINLTTSTVIPIMVKADRNITTGRADFNLLLFNESIIDDSSPPVLSLQSPVGNYGTNNISLLYTASDAHLGSCWYNLDNGANISIARCQNITFFSSNGQHTINLFANDTYGNQANVSSAYVSDTSVPTVNIQQPSENSKHTSVNITVDFTASNTVAIDSCWYSLDGGANTSLPSCQNTSFITTDGSHSLVIFANDSIGIIGNDTKLFSVDTFSPVVTLNTPTGLYTTTGVPLSYDASDANLDKCFFSLDGDANVTIGGCANATLTAGQGNHLLVLYANDTFGHVSSDSKTFSVDSLSPTITIQSPTALSLFPNSASITININFTVLDSGTGVNASTCAYSINNAANVSLPSCHNTTITLPRGSYTLKIYTGDNAGNTGIATSSFQIGITALVSGATANVSLIIPVFFSIFMIIASLAMLYVGYRNENKEMIIGAFVLLVFGLLLIGIINQLVVSMVSPTI